MPLKGQYAPAPPPPEKSFTDKLRDLTATGVRIGSGWGASIPAMVPGVGSLIGGGIAGVGEGAAELIEGSPLSPGRIATEAVLGGIPLGKVFKAGQVAQSALRSGALSGVGTAMRQQARGEDLNMGEITNTALIGGLTGGALGHLTKGKPTGPAPEFDVIEQAGGKSVNVPRTPPPSTPPIPPTDPRAAYFAKQGLNPPTAPGRMASPQNQLPFGAPESGIGGGVPTPYGIPAATSSRASTKAGIAAEEKAAAADRKAEDEFLRRGIIDQTIKEGGLVPGASKVSRSISAPTEEGGTIRQTTPYKAPKKADGEGEVSWDDLDDVPGGPAGGAPVKGLSPTGSPAPSSYKEKYGLESNAEFEAQRAAVRASEDALRAERTSQTPATPQSPLAAVLTPKPARAPRTPKTPTLKQQAQDESLNALRAKLGMEPATPGAGGVALETPPPVGPREAPPVSTDSIARAKAAAAAEREAYEASKGPGGGATTAGRGGVEAPEGPVLIPELVQEPLNAPPPVMDVWEEAANAATPVGRGRSQGAIPKIEAPAPPAEPESVLARFFKTRMDASGQANRDIKAAKAAGEQVPEAGRSATGAALRREAQAAGLPTGKAAKAAPIPFEGAKNRQVNNQLMDKMGNLTDDEIHSLDSVDDFGKPLSLADQGIETPPPAPGVSQTSKAREAALAARAAKRGSTEPPLTGNKLADLFRSKGREDLAGQQVKPKGPKGGSETGAVDVASLAMLLRAGVGAGVGGALGGSVDHPLLGAIGGAAAGAFGPAALSAMAGHLSAAGVAPDVVANLPTDLQTAGIKETAKKIWHTLPQIQRFNFLADVPGGLFANAVVGPYGSAVMAALEHGLSGDPRGWAALKLLSPQRFAQEMKGSLGEAGKRIAEGEMGRAESASSLFKPIQVPGFPDAVNPLQLPGQTMTSGDIAAKNILRQAGFTEAETQRITLTSEPEAVLPKKLANFNRGERDWSTPIGELMAPFTRTPANVWEQGAQRMPVVGSVVQSFRNTPDSFKQQMVQQGMSLGVGGLSGVLGANVDPETAKWMRRYVSNAGGQYSLPATMGFAAGQAISGDKPSIPAAVSAGINQLPLPATQTVSDIASFLGGEGRAPRGIAPPFIRDLAFPAETPGSTTGGYDPLPGVPSLRSLRGQ